MVNISFSGSNILDPLVQNTLQTTIYYKYFTKYKLLPGNILEDSEIMPIYIVEISEF